MTDLPGTIEAEIAKELVKALLGGLIGLAKKVPAVFARLGKAKQDQRLAQIEATATELAAVEGSERERLATRQEAVWEERFTDLVAEHPEAAADLRDLLAHLRAAVAEAGAPGGGVSQHIHAGRDAYTAGRDQNFGTGPDRSPE